MKPDLDKMQFPPQSGAEEEFMHFVAANAGIGFGRMMQLVSDYWRTKDPVGALSVGPCFGTVDVKVEDVKIAQLQFPDDKGGMTATFRHSAVPLMAEQFVKLFKESGGVNYVEWTLEDKKSPEVGPFTIMIQRRDGMTASEKASRYRTALEKIAKAEGDGACNFRDVADEALREAIEKKS